MTIPKPHGDTIPGELNDELPGGLGRPLPREESPALDEIRKRVEARRSGPARDYGIEIDADGRMRTTTRPA